MPPLASRDGLLGRSISTGRELGEKKPLGSRERAPVHVRCEHKDRSRISIFRAIFRFASKQSWCSKDFELPSRETKASRSWRRKLPPNATGWVLERSKTCETSGEGGLQSSGPHRDVSDLQGKHSRLETKRKGLRPREILRWDRAQRRPFDAIEKPCLPCVIGR